MATSVLAALWLVILGSRDGLAGPRTGAYWLAAMAARIWSRFKHVFALQ
jgi:hypothetical protein